ncbi:SAM-dependent methyltransferase [Methanobrevibacter sp. 87.7]|uniref:class I SAM-dependent methyltransferase n=1 Tax=Methanobrevibacter sp. 87.7 TaxID=387957 RepID=UPI000B5045A5|nr:class I SAM-dependent methyltransferase [Methanobrevibacter sp. 87.7]OWT33198.1 SAM-dependent methyltransferase [Methanobrevibacter sp. 87.7]
MKKGMMTPANGHRVQGMSSESFLDGKEILNNLNLNGNEVFMDAGCGDGHIALEARNLLNKDAKIYAVDIYEQSIEDLKKQVNEENIDNIIPLVGDFTSHVNVSDDSIDVILMVNVFHGFNAVRKLDETVEELKRIIKPGGKIAIMDYKKQEARHGPPYPIRMSSEEIEELFNKHGLKLLKLISDTGEDIETGKSHYLIIFTK